MKKEKIKGGLADNLTCEDIAKKHKVDLSKIKKEFIMGVKVEMEHTDDKDKAEEIAKDHLYESPNYYTELKKMEDKMEGDVDESATSGGSGSYEGPAFGKPITKREIYKIHNSKTYDPSNINEQEDLEVEEEEGETKEGDVDEATTTATSASGQYDAAFGSGGKNPLKIDGPSSIKKSRAVKDKKFPKWGGPDAVFVEVKDKCKKFPYCNQGDINALNLYEIDGMKKIIEETSKKYYLTNKDVENMLLNEIKRIFI
jgi:hypothetical protein